MEGGHGMKERRRFSAEFKARAARKALPEVFSRRREHNRKAEEALKDRPADAGSASSSSCFVAKCLYFAE